MATTKPAKIRVGDRIRIKKQVFIEKGSNFSLDEGEVYSVQFVTATGAVGITKNFKSGVTKKAMVSKGYYERA